jgi:hypothetical protein
VRAASKPKIVYDNDNFPPGHGFGGSSSFPAPDVIVSAANECDRTCLARLAGELHEPGTGSVAWKRQMLLTVDSVNHYTEWQKLLWDLAVVRKKSCEINREKAEELGQLPSARFVGDKELSIEEKYEKKFKDNNNELMQLYHEEYKFLPLKEPLKLAFMQRQVYQVVETPCVLPRVQPQPDADDPADP